MLLISSTFRYTTLCERIEHYIARIDYNHDLYICMFSQFINIHSSKFIRIYISVCMYKLTASDVVIKSTAKSVKVLKVLMHCKT